MIQIGPFSSHVEGDEDDDDIMPLVRRKKTH